MPGVRRREAHCSSTAPIITRDSASGGIKFAGLAILPAMRIGSVGEMISPGTFTSLGLAPGSGVSAFASGLPMICCASSITPRPGSVTPIMKRSMPDAEDGISPRFTASSKVAF